MSMASYNTKTSQKPLKGGQTISGIGIFDTLSANSIVLENVSIAGVYENGIFQNVSILNSTIVNTPIGIGGPSIGIFTDLKSTQTVNFLGSVLNQYVSWDPLTGIFDISGELQVNGCSYFDNIEICVNTISATNTDGDINIVSNRNGSVHVDGALINVATTGNFSSKLLSGSFNVNAYSNVSIGSQYSDISMSSYKEHNIYTLNGDINLKTELGSGNKLISTLALISSGSSTGLYQITSLTNHSLREGDTINIQGISYSPFNGTYSINSIIDNLNFTFTSGNINITRGSSGLFNKLPNNNINLSAGSHVIIPKNIDLIFGETSNNIVGDTLGNLRLSSYNNIFLNPAGSYINIPQNVYTSYGTSGTNYIKFDGNFLNIASNTIQYTGGTTLINTVNTKFYDPILTLANYTLNANDNLDRGIEFNFYNTRASLGWFGYKNDINAFTFLTNVTNNNEIITGTMGDFVIGNLKMYGNLSLLNNSTIDINCGELINVNTIKGCGNNLNISGKTTVNITSNNINLNAVSSINIPNNVYVNLGTSGNSIYESGSNMILSSDKNIKLNAINNVIIPSNIPLSFDGTTSGTSIIKNDTNGNMIIKSGSVCNTYISSANVIVPLLTNLQFGDSSKTIYGENNSLNMNSTVTTNIKSMNNVNVMSSIGSVNVNTPNGDITLYTTLGSVRIPSNINLFFGSLNSINVSNGNMFLNGSGTNSINLSNINTINLSASQNINILDNTRLNIGSGSQKYMYSDTSNNMYIVNATGTLILNSPTELITCSNLIIKSNTSTINNSNLYITSSNTIIGTNENDTSWINTSNLNITDPNITINYSNLNLLADKGVGYNYGSSSYGWFGVKTLTNRFTFYSNATNANNIISGNYGDIQINTLYAENGISTSKDINLNCNSLLNANVISSCNGDITITCSNIYLSAKNNVELPYNTKLMFGTTGNTIFGDTYGNLNLNTSNAAGTIVINGNLQVNGVSTNVYSTITNIQDPILSIGGVTGPVVNDAKDRGIEFKWAQTSLTKTGFFGFQNLTNRLVYIPDGINIYEVFYGSYGSVQFGDGYFSNLDLNSGNGNISGVQTISSNAQLTINSTDLTLNTNTMIPYNKYLYFGNTSNSIMCNTSNNFIISSGTLTLANTNIRIKDTSPIYYGNDNTIYSTRDSNGNFIINNTNGSINLFSSNSINVVDTIPINFGSTSDQIYSKDQALYLIGYNGITISSGNISLNGDVNIAGNISAISNDIDINKYILPLGTSQIIPITNIINNTNGSVQITLSSPSYITTGNTVTLTNTNSTPNVNGTWLVNSIINSTTFTINSNSILTTPGNNGRFKSNLTTNQGKDVGIQVNYWATSANSLTTAGSSNYKTGFFGYKLSTNNWVFYNDATIANNVVTGNLGAVTIDTLNTKYISSFILNGGITAGSNAIIGNNFLISGGTIDNTPIGTNIAQSGRFNILSNTVSASFENVSLQSNLMYSFERYTLSSLSQYRNPSINTIVSFVSVNGVSFNASGTLGTVGISDGQIKNIICSSIGANCTYTVHVGDLVAPNIGNNTLATKLQFIRAGQTAQLIFDAQLSSWIVLGRGCSVV